MAQSEPESAPKIVAQYEYIHVKVYPKRKFRKTCQFAIVNNKSNGTLAMISWYGAWRQYTMKPVANTIWSIGCLEDVIKFMAELKADRSKFEETSDATAG